jgi:Mrp family chromosome partitioning ATPase
MGKVYDALQRAEAQRSRSAARDSSPHSVQWSDEKRPRTATRRSAWTHWLGRRRPRAREGAATINKRRIALLQPESFVAEQFRSLRARIDSIAAHQPTRTIAVASALAGEGKTLAAVNLALVSAMSIGRRVLLVDCDLRNPRLHQALGLQPEVGIAEVLMGQATLEDALLRVAGSDLEVLPVRGQPSNPSELLASQVLVVRAEMTSQEEVMAALDVLGRDCVLGLVLNGVEANEERYGSRA